MRSRCRVPRFLCWFRPRLRPCQYWTRRGCSRGRPCARRLRTSLGHRLRYSVLVGRFAICRLAPDSAVPEWAAGVEFVSITRTKNELSVVCGENCVPSEIQAEGDWACIQLQGPFPFDMTGVLAAILNPLAA